MCCVSGSYRTSTVHASVHTVVVAAAPIRPYGSNCLGSVPEHFRGSPDSLSHSYNSDHPRQPSEDHSHMDVVQSWTANETAEQMGWTCPCATIVADHPEVRLVDGHVACGCQCKQRGFPLEGGSMGFFSSGCHQMDARSWPSMVAYG